MSTEVAKERPILFRSAMVKAILEGRKMQTRRVAKALLGNNPKLEYRVREADGEVEKREDFIRRWDYIYSKRGYGWDKNPWVWVVEFSRIQREAAHAGD